ncbi:MAG: hypothetical protein ABJO27_10040 [Pseudoruegeria sp.]
MLQKMGQDRHSPVWVKNNLIDTDVVAITDHPTLRTGPDGIPLSSYEAHVPSHRQLDNTVRTPSGPSHEY